jgi:hypothetical protein
MIEAVENHMPEVIVIDEIGTELESLAARTIAERGVQLIGTAHGQTLDNLMVNPTLSDLIGGIQAVTLGDDEARRRGTQKTVLERKAPPTFDVLVEIQSWDQVAVYGDVASAVDALLRGEMPDAEHRAKDADGQVKVVAAPQRDLPNSPSFAQRRGQFGPDGRDGRDGRNGRGGRNGRDDGPFRERDFERPRDSRVAPPPAAAASVVAAQRIFPFGVSRNRLEDAIKRMRVPATIVRDLSEASLVMTLKNYYRQSSQRLRQAEEQGVPVYVLRNNTITQMEKQLATIFHLRQDDDDDRRAPNGEEAVEEAMLEAETAITQVINGERSTVELAPQGSYIRKLQHQMADRYNLSSESRGSEPHRRVKIYR